MTSTKHSKNTAGPARRRGANRWKLAFLGWLAVVGLAVVVGVVDATLPEASAVDTRTATVVVEADDVTSPAVRRGIDDLRLEALFDARFGSKMKVAVEPGRSVATIAIPLQVGGSGARADEAVNTLVEEMIPVTIGAVAGTTVTVNGETVDTSDLEQTLKSRAPLIVLTSLLAVAFLLLLITRPRARLLAA